uniref:1-phosphatidylinositol-4-phosphate 5-kinase n=1 Tax=Solanum tuberosum TaxID=4113 RepID=M1B076_SOLTU
MTMKLLAYMFYLYFLPLTWFLLFNIGMEIIMLGNILLIRCMVSEYMFLQMGIGMKEPGMREGDKGLGCILLETGKPSLVIGKMGSLTFQVHRTTPILYLLLLFTIPKC